MPPRTGAEPRAELRREAARKAAGERGGGGGRERGSGRGFGGAPRSGGPVPAPPSCRLRWGLAAVRPRGRVPAPGREQGGHGDGPGVRRRESGQRGGVSGDGPSAPSPGGCGEGERGSEGQAAPRRPCPRRGESAARGRRLPALGPGQGDAGLPAARPLGLLRPRRAPGARLHVHRLRPCRGCRAGLRAREGGQAPGGCRGRGGGGWPRVSLCPGK